MIIYKIVCVSFALNIPGKWTKACTQTHMPANTLKSQNVISHRVDEWVYVVSYYSIRLIFFFIISNCLCGWPYMHTLNAAVMWATRPRLLHPLNTYSSWNRFSYKYFLPCLQIDFCHTRIEKMKRFKLLSVAEKKLKNRVWLYYEVCIVVGRHVYASVDFFSFGRTFIFATYAR